MKKQIFLFIILLVCSANLSAQKKNCEIVLRPAGSILMTDSIQSAIDRCAVAGEGIVRFTEGTYISGGIQLKGKVTLYLEKGAVLRGSDKYSDYRNDAFIYGRDISDISIEGEGIIDGVDCYNPRGEEGFRGPHCIRLVNCRNIKLEGITIKNSANWAVNCRYCSGGIVTKVTIRGGHDGLHTRFCSNFQVSECDFRTGDDAFAGNDNRDFIISDCLVNTSCNGFRMGCYNLTVRRCRLWGPGEYSHKIQNRNNMLSAFVHFSPKDEKPQLTSGNWVIEDITVSNVDQFYVYNFRDGLWQTGQPVTNVSFINIRATGILGAFNIIGDADRKFSMHVENSSFSFREGTVYKGESFEGARLISASLFNASNFGKIELSNITLTKSGTIPVLNCTSGNSILLKRVRFKSDSKPQPYSLREIGDIKLTDNEFIPFSTLSQPAFNKQQKNGLTFDLSNYEFQTINYEGSIIRVRAFENIIYVENPVDTVYQKMNIYIPEAYFNGESINGYTSTTAPVFYPNQVGGYMPAQPATLIPAKGMGSSQVTQNTVAFMLSKGYVVASAGARGRTLQNAAGVYTGKAPSGLIDLKAGIRYLKYNDANMPGNACKIISSGTSAGGAMSSLLGATANHPDYEPYLEEIGAAEGTDEIFAAQCYCPIINLENADIAYEWQFHGVNEYEKRQRGTTAAIFDLTDEQTKVSTELHAGFPGYINRLGLRDKEGDSLVLDEEGNGSFKEFVKSYIIASAQKALDNGADLSNHSWIEISNGKIINLDYGSYIDYLKRMKTPPAFDGLDLSTPENQLFGTSIIDKQHFTSYSLKNSKAHGATMADTRIIKMMNPMYYIGDSEANVARYWRIRHGAKDKDTSLGIPVILGTFLQNNGFDVDFELPWDRPHSGDYDLEELADWIDTIVKK